jgi:hypothetical protein
MLSDTVLSLFFRPHLSISDLAAGEHNQFYSAKTIYVLHFLLSRNRLMHKAITIWCPYDW